MIKNILKLLMWIAVAIVVINFIIFSIYIMQDTTSHRITRQDQQRKFDIAFHKFGLASLPENATVILESIIGEEDWGFRSDNGTVNEWLTNSRSIIGSEVITKRNWKAYIIADDTINKVTIVMVHHKKEDTKVYIFATDVISDKNRKPQGNYYTKETAIDMYKDIFEVYSCRDKSQLSE